MHTIEYRVETACGRTFCWSALDEDQLNRDLTEKGYQAVNVQTMTEYEQEMMWEQKRLVRELEEAIEEGAA